METMTATTTICLEAGCDHAQCAELAHRIYTQLNVPKYTDGMSIMPVPETVDEWRQEHRTARKRADRASRLGYRFAQIDRSVYSDDIHAINVSKRERQGRPMSDGYTTKRNQGRLPDYPCDRHRISTFGVLHEDMLVAYLTLYRVGELALVSMILGHGDHLANDIMYLLAAGMIDDQAGQGGSLFYNRHDSGTDGLRYFKERLGFACTDIGWLLG